MVDDKAKWALELASRGIRILPVHYTHPDGSCSCGKPLEGEERCRTPGKHPMGYRWEALATTDAKTIEKWFCETPDMNYGLMAGEDFLFVDMDTKDADGWQSLADLFGISRSDVQDLSFCTVTPSGGGHLYFKAEREYGNTSRTALGAGIDTRSGNGQILGPGSGNYLPFTDEFGETFYEKRYYTVANDGAIAPLPRVIESKLTRAKEKSDNADQSVLPTLIDHPAAIARARSLLKLRKPAIEGQGGDNHTFVTILVCRDCNLSPEKTLELLTEEGGWNSRCEPPWDLGELQTKIENAYAYAKEPQGNKGGMLLEAADERSALTGDADIDGDSVLPKDFNDPPKPKFNFYDGAVVNSLDVHYDFIIDGWLPAKNFTIVLGDRGAGKTTFIMDAVCAVASDAKWHGTDVDKDWMVFYIAAEDFPGVKERYESWCTKNQSLCSYNEETKRWQLKDPSRIQFIDMTINLLDEEEVFEFGKAVVELKRKVEKTRGKETRVIFVFDTWQRVTAAAEGGQSSDESIQKAAGNLEALGRALRGPCIVAAHPPKSNANTMAGTSITENRSDAVWQVQKDDPNAKGAPQLPPGIRRLKLTRIKGATEMVYKDFMFCTVDIAGVDKFGRNRKSVVVDYRGGSFATNQEDPKDESKLDPQAVDNMNLLRIVRDVCFNIGNYDPELNKDGKPISLATVVGILNVCVNTVEPTDEYAKDWKSRMAAINYTEHYFPPFKHPTAISRSAIYDRIVGIVMAKNNSFDFVDGFALTLVKHRNFWVINIVKTGTTMEQWEEAEESVEMTPIDKPAQTEVSREAEDIDYEEIDFEEPKENE